MNQETCLHCCTKIENLTVKFDDTVIVENFNLHINCKELIAVVGPNGTGKTTLLRAILEEIPYTGSVHYRVKGSLDEKPMIGYVPQKLHFDLDSPISVSDFVDKKIGEISGGEMQKILLSIAMRPIPNLLLLDEPDAGVDTYGLSLLYKIISDLRKQHDISIIMVTHDLEGISAYADNFVK